MSDPYDGYVGEKTLINTLRSFESLSPFPHIFLTAISGTGKTELARRIANAIGAPFFAEIPCTKSLNVEKVLYRYNGNWTEGGGVLFFDEVSLLSMQSQASLRTLTESGIFGDSLGFNYEFPNLTVIAAATSTVKIDPEWLNRFEVMEFAGLSDMELCEIGKGFAKQIGMKISPDVLYDLAIACNGVPRNLRNMIKHAAKSLDNRGEEITTESVLKLSRVDTDGMTPIEVTYLLKAKEFTTQGITPTHSRVSSALKRQEFALRPIRESLENRGYLATGMGPGGTRITPDGFAKCREIQSQK